MRRMFQLRNLHAECTLDGWNDGIIQLARDAVLNYFKVRVSISSLTVLAPKPIHPNSIF